MTTIPHDEAQTIASEIDRLIGLADSYDDFVLDALLCRARDHLDQVTDDRIAPSA